MRPKLVMSGWVNRSRCGEANRLRVRYRNYTARSVTTGDESQGKTSMQTDISDEVARIFERAKYEALAVIASQPIPQETAKESTPEWMTITELACYWRIFNDEGKPVTAGILSWSNRSPDEHPLPYGSVGDMRRFHRETADEWAWEESERRRAKKARRGLKSLST